MADDMGYADLSCYGSNTINTPHIDSLARDGLKLTNYHSNGVVCSPTRAALLTGLYPQEAGIEGVVTAKSHRFTGMSPDQYTLAEFFKEVGYSTALFGKWHLGYEAQFGPAAQGFDDFRGFVSGNIDYQSHIDQEGYADWWEEKALKPEEGYLTNIITDHGIRFMENVKDQPFFLYLPHGAPHYPYQGPDDPADRTVGGDFPVSGSRKDVKEAYKEMVESLDKNVGRIMDYLKANALLENTVVIFCSDNGASQQAGSNAPFRGYKGQVYEGGHRVPAIFYWDGKIPAGVSDELMLSMDIFPTLADLLKVDISSNLQISGKSMASSIVDKNENTTGERTVFWRFKEQKAARKGKWKLLIDQNEMSLYNLSEDPAESRDVKEENQPILMELKQALEQWESQLKVEIIAL
jgi:arylsulfatase A-like enzyme